MVARITAGGGTAMYDALAEAVPHGADRREPQEGAIVLISDGNDTDSDSTLGQVKQLIRESEVMVYAIGIDGQVRKTSTDSASPTPAADFRRRLPCPFRFLAAASRGPGGVSPGCRRFMAVPAGGGGGVQTVRTMAIA